MNTLNTHPVLGTVALLHSHRPVLPLAFGGEETDDWSICDWCDQCHRKGGLTVWVDAFEPAGGLVGGEALVAAILGKIDAIEVTGRPRKSPLLPWVYRLWDAGFLIPLVGASGKDSNRIALGQMRTLADCRELPWIEAVRVGKNVRYQWTASAIGERERSVRHLGCMSGRLGTIGDRCERASGREGRRIRPRPMSRRGG